MMFNFDEQLQEAIEKMNMISGYLIASGKKDSLDVSAIQVLSFLNEFKKERQSSLDKSIPINSGADCQSSSEGKEVLF